jgi:hypothetical protein
LKKSAKGLWMITANDESPSPIDLAPQTWGIWPTREFWQDLDNQQRGMMLMIAWGAGLVMPISDIFGDVPWWGAAVIGAVFVFPATWLVKGLTERYLRWKCSRGSPVLPVGYLAIVAMASVVGAIWIAVLELPLWIEMPITIGLTAASFGVARGIWGLWGGPG